MAPRRPPPLPKSLFEQDGPLAPGTGHILPSPASLYPSTIVDGCYAGTDCRNSYGSATLSAAVPMTSDVSRPADIRFANPLETISVLEDSSIKITNRPSGVSGTSKSIQINVYRPSPLLATSEWDVIEELINRLSVGKPPVLSEGESGLETRMSEVGDQQPELGPHGTVVVDKKPIIIIAGLLPPPASAHLPSQQLLASQLYLSYVNHLSALSLHENVHLLLTPPILSNRQPEDAKPMGQWWKERAELERVVRMYVSTALECFGSHRIIFGSGNPASSPQSEVISSRDWYTMIVQTIAELVAGEGTQEGRLAMESIFANNALSIYHRDHTNEEA